MGRTKGKIDEKKFTSWKRLDDFRRRLAKAQAAAPTREKRPGGPERLLLDDDYFSLMLFGLFNPVLDSMRDLCAARHPSHLILDFPPPAFTFIPKRPRIWTLARSASVCLIHCLSQFR